MLPLGVLKEIKMYLDLIFMAIHAVTCKFLICLG